MKSLILAGLILVAPLALRADDPPSAKDDSSVYKEKIVVTATALPETLDETPASVTVITRKEIEERGARDLVDVLREVPGVSVSRYGSSGKGTSLFIRGGSSQQALVLWNGIEISDPYFAGYDWGQFSTSGIDRVEIVRGPFSALYGSDAMSGVVNIITTPGSPGMHVDVSAGERGLLDGRVGGTTISGDWTLDGTVERREDDGWFTNDDLRQTSITAGARWHGSDTFSAGLFGRWSDYELGIPFNEQFGIDHLVPSPARRQEGRELQIAIPLDGRLGVAKWNLTLSQTDHDITLRDPDDPFGFIFQTETSVTRRAHATMTVPTRIGTVVAGAEASRARVDDDSTFGVNLAGETRDSRSLFVEDRLSRSLAGGAIEMSVGGRWDDFDTFGSEVSPRFAIAWRRGANKLRGAWGRSFRAPSVGELYFPFSGNTDLSPERSRSWEVGVERDLRRGRASLTWFHSSYDDLIVFDNASYRFENIGAATTRGVEVAIDGRIAARWHGGLAYTWLDTSQAGSGEPLLRRPKHSGSVNLGWEGDRASAMLTMIRTGSRADILPVFPYDRIVASAWTTVDVRGSWRFREIQPYVKVENLLDERYEEIAGFPSPGRRAIVGLRYIR